MPLADYLSIVCAQADLLHLGVLINDLPDNSIPVIAGIGNSQLPMNAVAIAMEYGVRVGLEDNIWYDKDRQVLATNESYLRRIHCIADAIGRPVYTGAQLREILHLNPDTATSEMPELFRVTSFDSTHRPLSPPTWEDHVYTALQFCPR